MSHRTASVALLGQVAMPAGDVPQVLAELSASEAIDEVLLLSTCNRVEVYAEVPRFHPALAQISAVLARRAGLSVSELGEHVYVHFAEAAVEHMFSVAAGLDSMVVGESQILGQLRAAYGAAVSATTAGAVLHGLAQAALRVGKRVHTDTDLDHAGASVVSVALDRAAEAFGSLAGRRVALVGAGSMGALAGATLRRRGVSDFVVVNRSAERAERLAASLGGRAADPHELRDALAGADLVVSSTGAVGLVIVAEDFPADRLAERGGAPLVVVDLALPRDVDPAVGALPGVTLIDLDALRVGGGPVNEAEVGAAMAIVAEELREHLTERQRLAVAPTITALRSRADAVIDAELARLDARLPELDPATRREVLIAVRRAVEKVLHAPTVRVKELAGTPGGDRYAVALRRLFDLDPAAIESVAAVRPASADQPAGGGPR